MRMKIFLFILILRSMYIIIPNYAHVHYCILMSSHQWHKDDSHSELALKRKNFFRGFPPQLHEALPMQNSTFISEQKFNFLRFKISYVGTTFC